MVCPCLFAAVYPAGVVVLLTQAGARMSVVNFYQLWLLTQSLSEPLRSIVLLKVTKLSFTFKPGTVYMKNHTDIQVSKCVGECLTNTLQVVSTTCILAFL